MPFFLSPGYCFLMGKAFTFFKCFILFLSLGDRRRKIKSTRSRHKVALLYDMADIGEDMGKRMEMREPKGDKSRNQKTNRKGGKSLSGGGVREEKIEGRAARVRLEIGAYA